MTSHSTECHLQQIANKLPTSVLDDNTSFFSSNSFQKLTAQSSHLNHNHIGENEDEVTDATEGESHPASILTDTLPNINTTEDWAAAFGFPRPAEQLVDVIGERNIVIYILALLITSLDIIRRIEENLIRRHIPF